MATHSRTVGSARSSTLVYAADPFDTTGPLPNEDSRATYTTAGSTACKKIAAHALGINDTYHKLLMIVPNTVDMNAFTPTVFVLHGVGNDETIILSGGKVGDNGMTDAWLDLGWIVVSATTGGVSWGNSTARAGMIDIWTWFTASCGFNTQGFLIYGVSMGGCSGLNFLLDSAMHGIPVVAYAGNSAASNFQYTYDHNGSLVGAMRTAYGLSSGILSSDPTYIAAVDTADGGHDPQKQTAGEYPTIPFAFYVGTSDGTINKTNNTDLFVAKLTAASWVPEVHQVSVAGADHTADSLFQPSDTNSFYQRALA